MAYNPCKNKNVNSGTTYQQQQGYFITKKGPHLSSDPIPDTLSEAVKTMESHGQ
jgi:hypothetical protein